MEELRLEIEELEERVAPGTLSMMLCDDQPAFRGLPREISGPTRAVLVSTPRC